MQNRFYWDDARIRFYRDAAEQSSYHQTLAERIKDALPQDGSVLDAGCGLGYLSTAMLPLCRSVTAVDCDPNVIAALAERTKGTRNLTVRCADVRWIDEPFDTVVCCYFGSIEESLRIFERTGANKLILIKRRASKRRFSDGQAHERTADNAAKTLCATGFFFRTLDVSIPFDQPLRSLDDAARFFACYRSDRTQPDRKAVEARLLRTDDPVFPFRLAVQNEMRIFFVD